MIKQTTINPKAKKQNNKQKNEHARETKPTHKLIIRKQSKHEQQTDNNKSEHTTTTKPPKTKKTTNTMIFKHNNPKTSTKSAIHRRPMRHDNKTQKRTQ